MSDRSNLDQVRSDALDRIDRSERNFKRIIMVAAVWEGLFLSAFILLADFSNRMHVLLLLTAFGIYSIVGIGLFALGAHVNRSMLRVLKAVELLKS